MNMPVFDFYSTVRGGSSSSRISDFHSETEFLNPQHVHNGSPSPNPSPNLSPNPSPARDHHQNRSRNRWRNPRFNFYQNRHQHFYNSPTPSTRSHSQNDEYPYQIHEPSPTPSIRSESHPPPPAQHPHPHLSPHFQLPGIPVQIPFPVAPHETPTRTSQNHSPYQNRRSLRGERQLVPPPGSNSNSRTRSPLPVPVPVQIPLQLPLPVPVPVQFQSSTSAPPPILPPLLPPIGDWNQNSIFNPSPNKSLISNPHPPNHHHHTSSNFASNPFSNSYSYSNVPSNNVGVALNSATQTAQTFLAGNPNFNYQTTMPLDLIKHRKIAQIISVIDAVNLNVFFMLYIFYFHFIFMSFFHFVKLIRINFKT